MDSIDTQGLKTELRNENISFALGKRLDLLLAQMAT